MGCFGFNAHAFEEKTKVGRHGFQHAGPTRASFHTAETSRGMFDEADLMLNAHGLLRPFSNLAEASESRTSYLALNTLD